MWLSGALLPSVYDLNYEYLCVYYRIEFCKGN